MSKGRGEDRVRMRVAHDLDDLPEEEDKAVILTIQDSSVLDNDTVPVLENSKMAAEYKLAFHKKVQEKLAGSYDPEDDFFKGKILPKYDEHKPEKDGFYIGANGEAESSAEDAFHRIQEKLGSNKGLFDLEVQKKVAEDYYTEAEFNGFSKKKKKQKEGKTNKSIRDFSFLRSVDEEAGETGEHLGKRNREEIEEIEKREENTLERRKELYTENMMRQSQVVKSQKAFEDNKSEDDYSALQAIIKNNQRIARESAKKAEEKLNFLLKPRSEENTSQAQSEEAEETSLGKKLELNQLQKVVEKVKEFHDPFARPEKYLFCDPRRKKLSLAHQASGIASVIDITMPSERLRDRTIHKEEEEMASIPMRLSKAEDNEEAETKDGEEPKPVLELPEETEGETALEPGETDGSIAATLNRLRRTGFLKKSNNNIYAGRNSDERRLRATERMRGQEDEDDGLKYEHRDKHGNLMTKKHAFRYMCWSFHDKAPSKIKQAKMAKKLKAQQQVEFL